MPAFDAICALLVLAGALKLRAPGATQRSLALAGLGVPALAVRTLGLAELALGTCAAVEPTVATAGLVAVAYGGLGAFVVRLRRHGAAADCGCFGGGGATVGRFHVGLNAIALVLAALAAADPPPGLDWIASRAPVVAIPVALGTGAAVFAAYLAFTALPDAWRAYGEEGS
jgi:hypothetical protein